jgi:hypothetical protein
MHVHQFGRIENMSVRAGEPVLDSDVKVVRVVRLGSESDPLKLTNAEDFELKIQVRDLFDELARLENGTVIRLEFRQALPFLLETTVGPPPKPPPGGLAAELTTGVKDIIHQVPAFLTRRRMPG